MQKSGMSDQDDSDLANFFDRLRTRDFDESTCFLCARSFENLGASSEHVFPKWLQKRFDLWDQQLYLLNRTIIPYRYLTVPCCVECNTYRLQPIETTVSEAVAKGYQALRNLDRKTLFLWLGKIFYGILYKELFLLLDRKTGSGITIATPELLREYETHLILLQQAREKVEFVGENPGSIFVFPTQMPEQVSLQWDICDNVDTMFIAIRMGEVGMIGVLADGGAQMIYEDDYKDIMKVPLHPIQFRELCAQFSYRSTLATRTPKYVTVQDRPHKMFQLPLGGFSLKPYFDEWDMAVYAKYLSFYTDVPYESIFRPPDQIATWLHDPSGKVQYLDIKKHPFP